MSETPQEQENYTPNCPVCGHFAVKAAKAEAKLERMRKTVESALATATQRVLAAEAERDALKAVLRELWRCIDPVFLSGELASRVDAAISGTEPFDSSSGEGCGVCGLAHAVDVCPLRAEGKP